MRGRVRDVLLVLLCIVIMIGAAYLADAVMPVPDGGICV